MFRRSFSTTVAKSFKVETVTPVSSESAYSTIKVIVNKAGSGSNDKPGLSHLLKNFAFLNSTEKSALRLKRESELIGGVYSSDLKRDSLELSATFPKEELPFYLNSLTNTFNNSLFKQHEFDELVKPFAHSENSIKDLPLDQLHYLSFRKGLGNPLHFDNTKSYTLEDVKELASQVYTKSNITFQLSNVESKDFENFLNESSFKTLAEGSATKPTTSKTFTGLESRIRNSGTTTAAIGVPVTDFETYSLLSAKLIDELSSIALTNPTTKFTSKVAKYESGSLFYLTIESSDAAQVSSLLSKAAKSIKSSTGLFAYKKLAELNIIESGSSKVDLSKAKDTVKNSAFNLVVVGDIDSVPFADEL